jgi:hypothetical protein
MYPSLFGCRARILSSTFCTTGNGLDWQDGRLGSRLTPKQLAKNIAQTDARDKQRVGLKGQPLPDEAPRPTEKQLDKILADTGTPRRLFKHDSFWMRFLERAKREGKEDAFWQKFSGSTLFGSLCSSSALNHVPDDVRPDWLAGIRETIQMIYRFDKPEQVQAAQQIQRDLEARFGPMHLWHKLKRRPTPPKTETPV